MAMDANMKDIAETFRKNKYAYLKGALNTDICGIAAQYGIFDSVVDFQEDVEQTKGAHVKYADSLMESLLLYMKPTVEKATGLRLYPTVSFYRIYKLGDELPKHIDRPSCEISISVCLGFNYDSADYSWPLWIGGTPYIMEVGDIAIYRGLEVEHWRDKLEGGENSWQVQAFLHYVDADGPYAFIKNDSRPAIGLPTSSQNGSLLDLADEIALKHEYPSFIYLTRG
jgi:hypothetical protein